MNTKWEKEFEDMFPFELETNIAIREDIKGGYHERIDVRDDVKAFIKSTLEAERTRIIKALEGLKEKHDHISDFIPEDHDDYRWALRDISADIALAYNSAIDQAIKAVEKGNK